MENQMKHSALSTRVVQLFSAVAIAAAILAQPLQAQAPGVDLRIGATTSAPTDRLANVFDYGYGLYARVGVPMGPISLMGAATVNRFKPKSDIFNDLDIVTMQVGPHLMVVPGFDVGIEGAYFSEVEEFGFVPVVSFGIPNLEATLSYSTTFDGPRTSWFSLGVGFKF
jgi:hypothetical protein